MTSKLKVLLLATMAMTAMTAFSVASAQAFTKFTNPEGGNTTITSTPDSTGRTAHHVFDTPAGAITCSTADFKGTTSASETTEETITFEYTNCTFDSLGTTLQPNGCDYVFHVNGAVDIKCSTGSEISYAVESCRIKIPAQTGLSGASGTAGITYTNINSSTEITATASVVSIHGTASGCPSGNGVFTNGEYTTGNTILTGEEDGVASPKMKPIRVS